MVMQDRKVPLQGGGILVQTGRIRASEFRRRVSVERNDLASRRAAEDWEIATDLKIEAGTIKTHLKSLFTKLGATTRTEAVRKAQERGFIHSS
jgi:hypothetical protein